MGRRARILSAAVLAVGYLLTIGTQGAGGGDALAGPKIPLVVITDLYHPNTFWKLETLEFIGKMEPKLRRYMSYALARINRVDFLRAMDEDDPAIQPALYRRTHNVWETSPWNAGTEIPQLQKRLRTMRRLL